MQRLKTLRRLTLAAAAFAGLVAAPAQAAFVDSFGDSFSLSFYGNGGALDATANFSVTNWGASSVVFSVDIFNNSSYASDRLTAFSIVGISQGLSGSASNNGWDTSRNRNAGGGYNPVALCIYDGQNCNGGGNQGVNGAGGTDSFALTLLFSGPIADGIEFDGSVAKFQTGNGSFHIAGCEIGVDRDCGPPVTVPEPATLALLGLGLLGVGVARRRHVIA